VSVVCTSHNFILPSSILRLVQILSFSLSHLPQTLASSRFLSHLFSIVIIKKPFNIAFHLGQVFSNNAILQASEIINVFHLILQRHQEPKCY
jgi:hypothetical protein